MELLIQSGSIHVGVGGVPFFRAGPLYRVHKSEMIAGLFFKLLARMKEIKSFSLGHPRRM